MQRSITRRIENLTEASLPLSPSVFARRVRTHARQTGMSYRAALKLLLTRVSDDDLEHLITESKKIAFAEEISSESIDAARFSDDDLERLVRESAPGCPSPDKLPEVPRLA